VTDVDVVEWELRRRRQIQPPPAQEAVWEAEWRERQAIESEWNTEVQWVRTFEACDADEFTGGLWFPYGDWGWRR